VMRCASFLSRALQEAIPASCLTLAVEYYVNDEDCDKETKEHEDENGGEVSLFSLMS